MASLKVLCEFPFSIQLFLYYGTPTVSSEFPLYNYSTHYLFYTCIDSEAATLTARQESAQARTECQLHVNKIKNLEEQVVQLNSQLHHSNTTLQVSILWYVCMQ